MPPLTLLVVCLVIAAFSTFALTLGGASLYVMLGEKSDQRKMGSAPHSDA